METPAIITAQPSTREQQNALEAFLSALKIKFKTAEEAPYNPEFVAKIEESRQQIKDGQSTRLEKEDIKEFLGL